MTIELEHLQQKSVLELAEQYKQQGYQVVVQLQGSDLHEFISNQEMDLIIHADQEAIVVAVKTRTPELIAQSLPTSHQNALPFKHSQLYDYPGRDAYDIKVYLSRIAEIIEMGAIDSAMRSTVFTAEAVMRMVAEHYEIDFEPQIPTQLAQTFLERGLISQEDYEVLVSAMELRDRMMYQQEKIAIDPIHAYKTVEVVQRLFQQAGEAEN